MKKVGLAVLGAVMCTLALAQRGDAVHAYDSRPHWRSEEPEVTVTLIDSVTRRWDKPLRDAAKDWSLSPEIKMLVARSSTSRRTRSKCSFGQGAIHVCNAGYGSDLGWAGLAEFTYNVNGHIENARIRLNDSTTAGIPGDVRRAVTCHEVGHTLGLGHYPDPQPPDSCMRKVAKPGGPEDPNAHDYAEITLSYGHLDAVLKTSSGQTTTTYWSDPLVRIRRDGRLTHVTWILPAP